MVIEHTLNTQGMASIHTLTVHYIDIRNVGFRRRQRQSELLLLIAFVPFCVVPLRFLSKEFICMYIRVVILIQ